jgi:hypothetical protein
MIPLERRLYTCTSRVFEDFDWEPVIFIQDVRRKTYEILLKIYIFIFKKSKIGHGGPTQNRIMRRTTVTEFSETFLVFYKWLNLTDDQCIVHSKVCHVIFVCCEHAPWYFYHFLVLQVNSILRLAILFFLPSPTGIK